MIAGIRLGVYGGWMSSSVAWNGDVFVGVWRKCESLPVSVFALRSFAACSRLACQDSDALRGECAWLGPGTDGPNSPNSVGVDGSAWLSPSLREW